MYVGVWINISLKILIFNNRDICNPEAGGSEVFTHEVSKIWASQGHDVTLVSSGYNGSDHREILDGTELIRLGNRYTVYLKARNYYHKHLKGKYDIIIDEYTLMPFMTPKFVREPIIFFPHELARKKYHYELPPLISHFFYHWEPRWLRNYLNVSTVTVSNSTKQDLHQCGFNTVHVVPEGINFKPVNKIPEKEEEPTILFVGLLKKTNLVDHAIQAFRYINREIPDSKMWIVGRGNQLKKLKKLAQGSNITFFGYVSEEKKLELMKKAHLVLFPAIREGWGLVVTESNANGTPVIGYDVPGLRDSIKNGKTGLLTQNNPKQMAEQAIKFFKDEEMRKKLTYNALQDSRKFSWEKTAQEFMDIMENYLGK